MKERHRERKSEWEQTHAYLNLRIDSIDCVEHQATNRERIREKIVNISFPICSFKYWTCRIEDSLALQPILEAKRLFNGKV